MIRELSIQNFRSIRKATLELGRFTVLTGANNSGKSSVLYALQVLKNVVSNPNRSVDEFLNLGFLNLGGLKEIVFNNDTTNAIQFQIKCVMPQSGLEVDYGCKLDNLSTLRIKGIQPFQFEDSLDLTFPNTGNKTNSVVLDTPNTPKYSFDWNGYTIGFLPFPTSPEGHIIVGENIDATHNVIVRMVNLPVWALLRVDVIPTSRGFTKPIFNAVPLSDSIYTEEELATLLSRDQELYLKVAHYFEKVTNHLFLINKPAEAGFFYLKVREATQSGIWTELINQGQGLNQITFLLTKILYSKNRLIGIDEPEIHLHPTLMEQFVRVLVEIAEKEDKQFVFSTHSEHWLMSLLAEVYEGNLSHENLKVYYLQKEGQETTVEAQQVQPNGQLEGGLKNFLDAQMHLTNRFFAATTV